MPQSWIIAPAMLLFSVSAYAQGVGGYWQATVDSGPFTRYRFCLKAMTSDSGRGYPVLFVIDQQIDWRPVPVSVEGPFIKATDFSNGGGYNGKLSADGGTIFGQWTQGAASQEVNFIRARSEAACRDQSPHTFQLVNVDDDVRLEVLDWGGSGRPLVLAIGSR